MAIKAHGTRNARTAAPFEPVARSRDTVQVESRHSAADTLARIEAAIEGVLERVAHAAAKQFERGMPIVFGNLKSGTGLMLKSPTSAIDFPLRALVYQDAQGSVRLAFNVPKHMTMP